MWIATSPEQLTALLCTDKLLIVAKAVAGPLFSG